MTIERIKEALEPTANGIIAITAASTVTISVIGFLLITGITGSGNWRADLSIGLICQLFIILMWVLTIVVLNIDAKYP